MPWFFDGLEAVHQAHPQLTVNLVEGPSDELQREVVGGRLDLALVGYAGAPALGLDVSSSSTSHSSPRCPPDIGWPDVAPSR